MKNFTLPLLFAFSISLLLHYWFYDSVNKVLEQQKLKMNTSNKKVEGKKGYTNIKFVKLRKPEPIKKPVKKPKLQQVQKKATPKKVKKVKKKTLPKKTPLIKKVKTINIPKIQKEKALKPLFTLTKQEKEKEKTEKEKLRVEMQELQTLDPLTQQYIKLYGKEYFTYSKEEKKYLKQNLNTIGRITQKYLRYPALSARTRQQGMNVVEFMLHPNGDITDLKLLDSSAFTMLDKNSIHTIKIAYKDYPKPKVVTKIRINIKYIIY